MSNEQGGQIETVLEITPQGACGPVRFEFGSCCGRQQTPSVALNWYEWKEKRMSAGMVLTHEDVDDLLVYLCKCRSVGVYTPKFDAMLAARKKGGTQ